MRRNLFWVCFMTICCSLTKAFQRNAILSHTRTPVSSLEESTSTTTTLEQPAGIEVIPILDQWKVMDDRSLEGNVWHHPEAENGARILTSPLVGSARSNFIVETISGSRYQLATPHEGREKDNDKMHLAAVSSEATSVEAEDESFDAKAVLQKIKDAGVAGVISYGVVQAVFWTISIPVCLVGYRQVTGHWPDLKNPDDIKELGVEGFAFLNLARFTIPLRISLALGATPFIQKNVVDRFADKNKKTSNTGDGGS